VTVSRLEEWVGEGDSKRISKNWGGRLDKAGIRTAGLYVYACMCIYVCVSGFVRMPASVLARIGADASIRQASGPYIHISNIHTY
jgi:hypothetical protein